MSILYEIEFAKLIIRYLNSQPLPAASVTYASMCARFANLSPQTVLKFTTPIFRRSFMTASIE